MKTITIVSYWRSEAEIEVEDDVDVRDDNFMEWPDDVLEQVTAGGAELHDWEVK